MSGMSFDQVEEYAYSYGLGQIMGYHTLPGGALAGKYTLQQVQTASEAQQIQIMGDFISSPSNVDLNTAVQNRNWTGVASAYNGESWQRYNPNYAINIEAYS